MLKVKDFLIMLIAVILTIGLMYLIQIELPKHMMNEIKCFDVYVKH